jgi:hypothetical protein
VCGCVGVWEGERATRAISTGRTCAFADAAMATTTMETSFISSRSASQGANAAPCRRVRNAAVCGLVCVSLCVRG